jgi:F420-0:gamma-glutamyl ligase-like protein
MTMKKRGWAWGATAAGGAAALTTGALLWRRTAARHRVITRGVTVDRPLDAVRGLVQDTGVMTAALGRPAKVTVQPAPADWGTEIYVEVDRAHDEAARTALRQVKSLIECGQVLSTREDPADRGPVAEAITNAMRDRLMAGGRA